MSQGDAQSQAAAAGAATMEVSEFQSLLQKEFKPKSDQAKQAVQNAVQTLAAKALKDPTLLQALAAAPKPADAVEQGQPQVEEK